MSLKVFCAIAAALGWELHHFDIKAAFLNVDTKESSFIELPENQVAGGADRIQPVGFEYHEPDIGMKG
ncbi:Reverse transcriptase RNA-dependent DNA polymerase [Penicillium mononematosum]|uniref:Reverse transcriptase RNA-dependent DNA polymerase n=1 Tax=Penicillium mononematosum TaxID=268346 RepID=UPI00254853FD|nr:Reverse transcriptase RNA-dependent DNA polymerase [Penicillium mononematosum]KAJ6177806.1 Reverse transcriptase RNA-dependent DNA polymerase [Penicillium mononematosum]